mmetsp:Transcript_54537/g.97394  ORF Transcript_54537/g.97394 Transcript_54537/m.97394 type:complete len:122 (+) Transcript_54537:777-1142(+)
MRMGPLPGSLNLCRKGLMLSEQCLLLTPGLCLMVPLPNPVQNCYWYKDYTKTTMLSDDIVGKQAHHNQEAYNRQKGIAQKPQSRLRLIGSLAHAVLNKSPSSELRWDTRRKCSCCSTSVKP